MRGVSAIRRKPSKHVSLLSVADLPLPVPVLDPALRSKPTVSPNHGLWNFFPLVQRETANGEGTVEQRVSMMTPEELAACGRAWSAEELRGKGWADLHGLWWACVRERNMLATVENERKRLKAGYGEAEFDERDKVVRETMRAIRYVLTERWYSFEEARKNARLAKKELWALAPAREFGDGYDKVLERAQTVEEAAREQAVEMKQSDREKRFSKIQEQEFKLLLEEERSQKVVEKVKLSPEEKAARVSEAKAKWESLTEEEKTASMEDAKRKSKEMKAAKLQRRGALMALARAKAEEVRIINLT
jgi:hypothetical protein